MNDFDDYFAATLDKPLHPIFEVLDPLLPTSGLALDLGCGVGTATLHLAERGLDVLAVDASPRAIAIVEQRAAGHPRIRTLLADLRRVELPPADVAVALFTLFFLPPDDLERFWRRLVATLNPGALFAGQFLGPHDDWADRCSTHAREALRPFLEPFETVYHDEVERDGKTATGHPKHWHVHHLVLRKRGP